MVCLISLNDLSCDCLEPKVVSSNLIRKQQGGETGSTGIYKLRLHVENSIFLVNIDRFIKIVADDYAYAVAA